VIGMSGYGTVHPFVYQKSSGMVDLNTLIPSGSGWTLESAFGINGTGQIVGQGSQGGGSYLSYLLTPTAAAASSLAVASAGATTTVDGSPATRLGTATAGSDDSGSLPQGPLGVMPDAAPWTAVPLLTAHRRHSTEVPNFLSTALDPVGHLTG
jgi:hypothetical protein